VLDLWRRAGVKFCWCAFASVWRRERLCSCVVVEGVENPRVAENSNERV
jgi:hypothetical protein